MDPLAYHRLVEVEGASCRPEAWVCRSELADRVHIVVVEHNRPGIVEDRVRSFVVHTAVEEHLEVVLGYCNHHNSLVAALVAVPWVAEALGSNRLAEEKVAVVEEVEALGEAEDHLPMSHLIDRLLRADSRPLDHLLPAAFPDFVDPEDLGCLTLCRYFTDL